jgi:hypothetical protein
MSNSYIYVIGGESPPYKVGISKHPDRRLKALQTGHPYKLTLHHTQPTDAAKTKLLETVIHRNLRSHRTQGEWFDIPIENLLLEIDFAIIRYGEDPLLRTLITNRLC